MISGASVYLLYADFFLLLIHADVEIAKYLFKKHVYLCTAQSACGYMHIVLSYGKNSLLIIFFHLRIYLWHNLKYFCALDESIRCSHFI